AVSTSVTPAVETYAVKTPITVTAAPGQCNFHLFVGPWSKFSDCDKAKDFLTKQGISFTSTDLPAGSADTIVTKIGATELKGWKEAEFKDALKAAGFPAKADPNQVNWVMTELILIIMVLYVTMV